MKLTKQILTKLVKEEKAKLKEAQYKTISLKDKKGFKEAEKLQKQGWVVKHVGLFTIDMVKEGIGEGKLTEAEKVMYVVGLENGEVMSGDKAVSEKKALQIMSRIARQSDGWVNPFMIGVKYWNGTHPKRKGKPHKANKKKIMVKEGKLTEGYDVIGYSKRLEKIYDEYGMVVGNLKTDLKNNGYKKESIELERAFGKFVYKFYMQTRNILRRTNEVKEGKLTEGIKRWKIYVKGQSKPFVVGADSSSKAKQLAHMMIKNSSIKIDKVVQEYRIRGNADNLLIRKGDIKKGMMVWFEDGKGRAQKLKVKHVMLSKDKKEEHYITNKGTFTPRDVVGY